MNNTNPKIIVVGSTNVDFCSHVARLPRPGETIGGGKFMQASGGKGANQAVAAARLGGDVKFITAVGNDSFGREQICNFQKASIDCSGIYCAEDVNTGIALIMIDEYGENCITVNPGANAMLTPERLSAIDDSINDADVLLMQAEISYITIKQVARKAKDAGVSVIFNPAPVCDIDAELMSMVDVLILNQTEAAILSAKDTEAEAACELINRGVKNVVITLGSKGACYYSSNGDVERISSYKVNAVDTVGAGDTFCGALAVAYAKHHTLDVASLQFASAAAALSVTRRGAQPSIPTIEETTKFMQENSNYNVSQYY